MVPVFDSSFPVGFPKKTDQQGVTPDNKRAQLSGPSWARRLASAAFAAPPRRLHAASRWSPGSAAAPLRCCPARGTRPKSGRGWAARLFFDHAPFGWFFWETNGNQAFWGLLKQDTPFKNQMKQTSGACFRSLASQSNMWNFPGPKPDLQSKGISLPPASLRLARRAADSGQSPRAVGRSRT